MSKPAVSHAEAPGELTGLHSRQMLLCALSAQTIPSLGPVYEFVCISFRTDNLNCFRAS